MSPGFNLPSTDALAVIVFDPLVVVSVSENVALFASARTTT